MSYYGLMSESSVSLFINKMIDITSNYGQVQIGYFYLGWNNHSRYLASEMDCGDENFGFAIGRFYVGCYSDRKWCAGFLNEFGYLDI
jgi:hypothetical protein